MFLVDANVLSESTKERPNASVIEWMTDNETQQVVNPIILGELEYGILQLPAGRRRTRLRTWFTEGLAHLRVVELDRETAEVWAALLARLRQRGFAMPVTDSLIAATALQHQLTVVTRNVRHYQHSGVRLLNPFDS